MYFTVQYIYEAMINNLKNISKKKIGGLLLILVIIVAFGFGGFGGGFNLGNQNNIAKINDINISTQDFMEYLNRSGLSQQVIKENIEKKILEELLSTLISTTLLNLEIKDLNLQVSEKIILKRLKQNKDFQDEEGEFQRTLYEKFLLTNNMSAPIYELKLKNNILQKQLFTYISGGTKSPQFLINKYFKEKKKKLNLEYINLEKFYKKKEQFSDEELRIFVNKNSNDLKQDYIDFSYTIITPKNLTGLEEFNQTFFDKIDELENKIAKNIDFDSIMNELNLTSISKKNYINLDNKETTENKIYNYRNSKIEILEDDGKYIFYKIENLESKLPNINNSKIKSQIKDLMYQKEKFEYNKKILDQISNQKFNQNSFDKLAKDGVNKIKIKSIEDDKKFEINSIKILYSLSVNSFTLVGDDMGNVFIAKIAGYEEESITNDSKEFKAISNEASAKNRNSILKSYDYLLNDKYKVVVNDKTLDRVKSYFK